MRTRSPPAPAPLLQIKGTHTAMKSGMVAADAIFAALKPEGAEEGKAMHSIVLLLLL